MARGGGCCGDELEVFCPSPQLLIRIQAQLQPVMQSTFKKLQSATRTALEFSAGVVVFFNSLRRTERENYGTWVMNNKKCQQTHSTNPQASVSFFLSFFSLLLSTLSLSPSKPLKVKELGAEDMGVRVFHLFRVFGLFLGGIDVAFSLFLRFALFHFALLLSLFRTFFSH